MKMSSYLHSKRHLKRSNILKKQVRTDIVARADDAFKSANYAEYSVDKKKEGKYLMQRILMILLYVVIFAVVGGIGIWIGIATGLGLFGVVLFALAPLAIWMMVYFTWKFVSIEYKYVIDHSEITVFTVYGGKDEVVAFKGKVKDFGEAKVIEAVPTMNTYDIYFGLHKDEQGNKTVVYFQATSHSLKAFKYYNKDALVMTETVR